MNYALIESRNGWAICSSADAPHGPHDDGDSVLTVAPWQFVERHPAYDGTDAGARLAVLAWAATV